MKQYYQMSRTEAQKAVNGSTQPLTNEQVKKNQETYGPNALTEEKKKSILQIFLERFSGHDSDSGSCGFRNSG